MSEVPLLTGYPGCGFCQELTSLYQFVGSENSGVNAVSVTQSWSVCQACGVHLNDYNHPRLLYVVSLCCFLRWNCPIVALMYREVPG